MPQGDVQLSAFSVEVLLRAVLADDSVELAVIAHEPAIAYLHAYLKELGALSMARETHYVDRHYLEDFSEHYARAFNAPDPTCERLHFFRTTLEDLERDFDSA